MRYLLACNFMQNMLTTTKKEMATLLELVAGIEKGLTVRLICFCDLPVLCVGLKRTILCL